MNFPLHKTEYNLYVQQGILAEKKTDRLQDAYHVLPEAEITSKSTYDPHEANKFLLQRVQELSSCVAKQQKEIEKLNKSLGRTSGAQSIAGAMERL